MYLHFLFETADCETSEASSLRWRAPGIHEIWAFSVERCVDNEELLFPTSQAIGWKNHLHAFQMSRGLKSQVIFYRSIKPMNARSGMLPESDGSTSNQNVQDTTSYQWS